MLAVVVGTLYYVGVASGAVLCSIAIVASLIKNIITLAAVVAILCGVARHAAFLFVLTKIFAVVAVAPCFGLCCVAAAGCLIKIFVFYLVLIIYFFMYNRCMNNDIYWYNKPIFLIYYLINEYWYYLTHLLIQCKNPFAKTRTQMLNVKTKPNQTNFQHLFLNLFEDFLHKDERVHVTIKSLIWWTQRWTQEAERSTRKQTLADMSRVYMYSV